MQLFKWFSFYYINVVSASFIAWDTNSSKGYAIRTLVLRFLYIKRSKCKILHRTRKNYCCGEKIPLQRHFLLQRYKNFREWSERKRNRCYKCNKCNKKITITPISPITPIAPILTLYYSIFFAVKPRSIISTSPSSVAFTMSDSLGLNSRVSGQAPASVLITTSRFEPSSSKA